MPVLMNTLISSLASASSERRQVCSSLLKSLATLNLYESELIIRVVNWQVAGRSLGELVRKLGERVLPLIIPILSKGLKDSSTSRRQVSL